MALTVQTGFKNSPWGCPLQRGAQPRAAGKGLLFCASFPRLSLVFCAIYYKQHSEAAASTFQPRHASLGAPRVARAPRPRPGLHAQERAMPSPTWVGKSARGRLRVRAERRPSRWPGRLLGRTRRWGDPGGGRSPRVSHLHHGARAAAARSAPPPHRAPRAGGSRVLCSAGSDPNRLSSRPGH